MKLPYRLRVAYAAGRRHRAAFASTRKIREIRVTKGGDSLRIKGKQRLIILAVLVLVLVGVAALITYPRTKRTQSAAAANATNATGGTSATADEVKAMASWGLKPGDLPGSQLQQGAGEVRDYALAQGNPQQAKAYADSGRVDGFSQIWRSTTAQGQLVSQFRVYVDLYSTPAQAMSFLDQPYAVSGSGALPKSTDDPKLGDGSRLFSASSAGAGGLQAWAVRWVRGRAVLSLDGIGPNGQVSQDALLKAAQTIDDRAKQAPIK